MLIKEESFRKLSGSYIILKNKELALKQAKLIKMAESIDESKLENIENEIDKINIDIEPNSVLLMPYIDYFNGLSFLTLAVCQLNDDNLVIYERENFKSILVSHISDIANEEFIYLKDTNIEGSFDLDYYSEYMRQVIPDYNLDEDVYKLRRILDLDPMRNKDFPDDVLVYFYKSGFNPEAMWVRYESIDGNAIVGVLLNNPSQDLKINEGDKIIFYLAEDTQNGNLMCISNLDND